MKIHAVQKPGSAHFHESSQEDIDALEIYVEAVKEYQKALQTRLDAAISL